MSKKLITAIVGGNDSGNAPITVFGANLTFWTKSPGLAAGTQAQLIDKSGSGNNTATQSTATARMTATASQLNAKTVLLADGGDFYALPSALYTLPAGANTVFAVAKRNTETGTAENLVVMVQAGVATRYQLAFGATSGQIVFRNGTATITSTGNINSKYKIVTATRSGVTQTLSIGGGTPVTAATAVDGTPVDAAHIGANNGTTTFLIGGLAELIIVNRPATASEILTTEIYLANEYGVYHPNAGWILSYEVILQSLIHALRLIKDDVGADTTNNTVAALYSPSRQSTGAITSLTDYGRGVNTATEVTNPPVNTANGIYNTNALLYNGTTTILNAGSNVSIDNLFAAGGTFIAVIKPTTAGENTSSTDGGRIFSKTESEFYLQDASAGTCALRFVRNFSVTNGDWKTTSRNITLGSINIIAITYDSSNVANVPAIYVNSLTAKAVTTTLVPTLTPTSDAASDMYIGNNAASSRTFDGYIGDIIFSKTAFTAAQLNTVITDLATKYNVTLT